MKKELALTTLFGVEEVVAGDKFPLVRMFHCVLRGSCSSAVLTVMMGIPTLGIGHLRWALGALEVTLGAAPGCRTTRSHAGMTTRSPANTQLSEEEAKLPFKAGSYRSCDRVILQ